MSAADRGRKLRTARGAAHERRATLRSKASCSSAATAPMSPAAAPGLWYKWKRDPLIADCVLMYAQRGSGKRSSYYSDYTFGCWNEEGELLPVGKAYFGFTDEELRWLDRWIRGHTVQRFGPVREVEKGLVLEVAFDSIHASTRHKSGLAMRFPRISRIRTDKPADEADRMADTAVDGNLKRCPEPLSLLISAGGDLHDQVFARWRRRAASCRGGQCGNLCNPGWAPDRRRGPSRAGPSTVIVENGRIVRIENGITAPPERRLSIERSRTVLPGMTDAHVHLTATSGEPWYIGYTQSRSNPYAATVGLTHALEMARGGFTTVRDLGGNTAAVIAVRDAVAEGRFQVRASRSRVILCRLSAVMPIQRPPAARARLGREPGAFDGRRLHRDATMPGDGAQARSGWRRCHQGHGHRRRARPRRDGTGATFHQ